HLVRRGVDERRHWVDEAVNKPGAGNTVDLGMFARDPFSAALRGTLEHAGKGLSLPRFNAAFQIGGIDASQAKSRRRPLAHLKPMNAVDDDLTVGWQRLPPGLHIIRGAADSGGDQAFGL